MDVFMLLAQEIIIIHLLLLMGKPPYKNMEEKEYKLQEFL